MNNMEISRLNHLRVFGVTAFACEYFILEHKLTVHITF